VYRRAVIGPRGFAGAFWLNPAGRSVDVLCMHRMVDELVGRTNLCLDANSKGHSVQDVWEAVATVLDEATPEELENALQEILAASKADDVDARDVVIAFDRLHPPQSLANPERQRSLVGNYLILRQ
jgi:hypothetical protein